MEKRNVILLFGILFLFAITSVIAQENLSLDSVQTNVSGQVNLSLSPVIENISNSSTGELILREIIPSEFRTGDVQFNIRFENNESNDLKDITPIVTGKGFSVTNVVPIDALGAGEKGYVIVMGNFKETGKVLLNIKVGNKNFNYSVSVSGDTGAQVVSSEVISNLSKELEEMKGKYATIEYMIGKKKDEGFDVSTIKLDDAKKYIRNAEANILSKDADSALVNLKLALEEIEDQSSKVEGAKEISSMDKLKNNAIIFSTIAGALIALFTLYELLKKKGSLAVEKVKEVKDKIAK